MNRARMQPGLCLASYSRAGLTAALTEVSELGALCLDLPTDTTLGLVPANRCLRDGRFVDEIAGTLTGAEVTCVSNSRDAQLLLGPHGPHTDAVLRGTPDEKRGHAADCILGTIRLAERLGAGAVRLLVGCPDFARWLSWPGSDVSWADNIAEFLSRAGSLFRAAGDAGLKVLLEPHPKQVIYDRPSAEYLLATAASWPDLLALCIDPANLAAMGHDEVAAVRGWGPHLHAVHAKDLERGGGAQAGHGWSRYGPQPPVRFRALGLGELNWQRIISTLIDEEFQGVIYVEHEDALLPRAQSVRHSVAALRAMLPAGKPEGRTW